MNRAIGSKNLFSSACCTYRNIIVLLVHSQHGTRILEMFFIAAYVFNRIDDFKYLNWTVSCLYLGALEMLGYVVLADGIWFSGWAL